MTPHHDAALILDDYQRRAEYLPDSSPSDSGARAALMALFEDISVGLALRAIDSSIKPLRYEVVRTMTGNDCDDMRCDIAIALQSAARSIRAKIAVTK